MNSEMKFKRGQEKQDGLKELYGECDKRSVIKRNWTTTKTVMLDVKKTSALEKAEGVLVFKFVRERERDHTTLLLCVSKLGFDLKWALRNVFVLHRTKWAFVCTSQYAIPCDHRAVILSYYGLHRFISLANQGLPPYVCI